MKSSAAAHARDLEDSARVYDADYYKSHLGPLPYSRETPEIMNFFGNIADNLTRSLNPKTVLDAGCAMGFLVESLWDRGVEAWGFDISPYAISQVRMDVRPYCSVASVAEPISRRYDLIACIEVLEHVPEETALQAIENLTKATDTILFSSSPNDFVEPTHVSVRPPMWWLSRFADFGFSPDVLHDCTFVSPQAMLLRKTGQLPYDVLRLFSNLLRSQGRALTAEGWGHQQAAAVRQMEQELTASRAQASGLTVEASRLEAAGQNLTDQVSKQATEISDWERRAMTMEQELTASRAQTSGLTVEVSRLEAAAQNLTDQVSKQATEISDWERRAMTMEQELTASGAQASGLTVEVSRLEAAAQNLTDQVSKQATEISDWERRAMNAEDRIEQLKTNTQDLQQALDASKSEAGHLSIEIARELSDVQQALDSMAARQAALEGRADTVAIEAGRAWEWAERSEQRIAILLQQIEQAVGTIDEVRQSVAMQDLSRENHLNREKTVSHNVETRCGQLAAMVQSMEPRLSDAHARLDEINSLNLKQHQQVQGLTTQVREILQSRFWRSLVNARGVVLKLTGRKH